MSEAKTNSGPAALWLQCAGILLAAVVLGLIYNSASPLRVRDPAAARTQAAEGSALPKPTTMRTGVFNETLSLTMELPAAPAPAPAGNPTLPALANPNPTAAKPFIPSLKWPEVKVLLEAGKIVLVDARLQANYDLGHIPGAVLLPATSTADELRAFAGKYPKPTAFVTYCGSDTCHMSQQLAELLVKICGFTNVSHMPGGFAEYLIASAQTR